MKKKELEKENEKLKQELADCVMSNELLDKENDRLREELQDYKNCNEMLDNEIERFKISDMEACKYVSELRKKLAEYEKFGLDKELEKLKHNEEFGYES